MVFMPNSRARPEDYCDGFGLTEHELALIRTLPAHSRCFLVRQPDASVVVRLDLSGAPEVLTVLSGRESAVRRLDLLRSAVGDAPADWFPTLTGTPWPGGANDALGTFPKGSTPSVWPPNERQLPPGRRAGRQWRRRSAARGRLHCGPGHIRSLRPPVRAGWIAEHGAHDRPHPLYRGLRLRPAYRAHQYRACARSSRA